MLAAQTGGLAMHEMSLAEGILKIALEYAEENEGQKVEEIGLIIGEMSGVVIDSLEFGFKMLAKGSIAEGAKLKVKEVPLRGRCTKCGEEMHVEHYDFWCPKCGDGVLEIVSGREMQVEYLEVE